MKLVSFIVLVGSKENIIICPFVNVFVPAVPLKISPVALLITPDVLDSETTVSSTTSWLVFTPPEATVKVPLFELVPLTTID